MNTQILRYLYALDASGSECVCVKDVIIEINDTGDRIKNELFIKQKLEAEKENLQCQCNDNYCQNKIDISCTFVRELT